MPNKPKESLALLTIAQVCEEVGISQSYFHKLCGAGKGPKKIKLSKKSVRITRSDLETWINNLAKEAR